MTEYRRGNRRFYRIRRRCGRSVNGAPWPDARMRSPGAYAPQPSEPAPAPKSCVQSAARLVMMRIRTFTKGDRVSRLLRHRRATRALLHDSQALHIALSATGSKGPDELRRRQDHQAQLSCGVGRTCISSSHNRRQICLSCETAGSNISKLRREGQLFPPCCLNVSDIPAVRASRAIVRARQA